MPIIETLIIVAMFGPTLAWLACIWRIERRLSLQHPAVFEEIGRPHLLFNNTFATNRRIRSFVWGTAPATLGDGALVRLCTVAKVSYVMAIVSLVFFVVTFAYALLVNKGTVRTCLLVATELLPPALTP